MVLRVGGRVKSSAYLYASMSGYPSQWLSDPVGVTVENLSVSIAGLRLGSYLRPLYLRLCRTDAETLLLPQYILAVCIRYNYMCLP